MLPDREGDPFRRNLTLEVSESFVTDGNGEVLIRAHRLEQGPGRRFDGERLFVNLELNQEREHTRTYRSEQDRYAKLDGMARYLNARNFSAVDGVHRGMYLYLFNGAVDLDDRAPMQETIATGRILGSESYAEDPLVLIIDLDRLAPEEHVQILPTRP